MGFTFIKLATGEIVSSHGGLCLKKIGTKVIPPKMTVDVDLSILGLGKGTHTLTIKATSRGLAKSDVSNAVIYTVT